MESEGSPDNSDQKLPNKTWLMMRLLELPSIQLT